MEKTKNLKRKLLSFLLAVSMAVSLLAGINVGAAIEKPIQSNITSTVMPYYTNEMAYYDWTKEENFTMSGKKYTDGYVTTVYSGISELYFNLNHEYDSISFEVGYVSHDSIDCNVRVLIDGETVEKTVIHPHDLSKTFTFNINGAKQLIIEMEIYNWPSYANYGIANIQLKRNENPVNRPVLKSNIMNSLEPYYISGCDTYRETEEESFEMTGRTYTDGYITDIFHGVAELCFNLNNEYESISFDVGYVKGNILSSKIRVIIDDSTIDTVSILHTDLSKNLSYNLSGARQLRIEIQSGESGSNTTHYGIGNIQLKSNGVLKNVNINKESLELNINKNAERLSAAPIPADAENFSLVWKSNNENVAIVDQTGLVTGLTSGTATITAQTPDGMYRDTCIVTVDMPSHFDDVAADSWYAGAVSYAYNFGLFSGTTPTMFEPDTAMTRAMLVTVLYRMEKTPSVTPDGRFTDVPADEWYSAAVEWAAANGIVNGTSPDTFAPAEMVKRQDMATILYRYAAEYKHYDVSAKANLSSFPDAADVDSYAAEPVSWTNAEGIITGKDGYIAPKASATRAEVATILMRFDLKH